MGEWKPKLVCWENVTNLRSKPMIHNFQKYLAEMERMGYTNSFATLDARDFGLPQSRKRVFTVSVLGDVAFDFSLMEKRPMQPISIFLEKDVADHYTVTQPSILEAIGKTGVIRRATIIRDYTGTITTRQDRTPTNVVDLGNGKYRYLTEKECWRLQGYSDALFHAAESSCPVPAGKMNRTLYQQAGNSIPVTIFESMFEAMVSQGLIDLPETAAQTNFLACC